MNILQVRNDEIETNKDAVSDRGIATETNGERLPSAAVQCNSIFWSDVNFFLENLGDNIGWGARTTPLIWSADWSAEGSSRKTARYFILLYKFLYENYPFADLKLILMSATINLTLFSDYFQGAPVIEVQNCQTLHYLWDERFAHKSGDAHMRARCIALGENKRAEFKDAEGHVVKSHGYSFPPPFVNIHLVDDKE